MLLGIGLLLVAAITLVTLVAAGRVASLPPHGRGCDCGECCKWYQERWNKKNITRRL